MSKSQAEFDAIYHQLELTPEREAQWQKQVMPILLDGLAQSAFESSLDGLLEAPQRLLDYMPIWAMQLRRLLIEGMVEAQSTYLAFFVVRVETAAAGISLLNPRIALLPPGQPVTPLCRESIYRRIAFRFLKEAILPLVPCLERLFDPGSMYRSSVSEYEYGKDNVLDVLRLCQRSPSLSFEEALRAWTHLELIGEEEPRKESRLDKDTIAIRCTINLAENCRGVALRLIRDYTEWWEADEPPARMIRLNSYLSSIIRYRNELYAFAFPDSDSQRDTIAQAFLIALEAECLPPDWIP